MTIFIQYRHNKSIILEIEAYITKFFNYLVSSDIFRGENIFLKQVSFSEMDVGRNKVDGNEKEDLSGTYVKRHPSGRMPVN